MRSALAPLSVTQNLPRYTGRAPTETYQENLPAVDEKLPPVCQEKPTNQEPVISLRGEVAAVAAPRVKKSGWGDPLDGLPAVLNVPEFVNVWLEFIAYRKKQSSKTLQSRSRVFAKAVEVGVPAAIRGMIRSMEKGWSGIHIETKINAKLEKCRGECPESLEVPVFWPGAGRPHGRRVRGQGERRAMR